MKKNLLAVLLPVVAGVALSGTGFGLWVFKEDVDNKLVGASMQVEPAINFKSDALSIESLSVTNTNGKVVVATEGPNKTIVFDQSDAKADSSVRWTVNITVGVTYTALFGTLRSETDGAGTYDTAADVKNGLRDALGLYQVAVYSPLSNTNGDTKCKIKSYLTTTEQSPVKLVNFEHVPTDDDAFEEAMKKITHTFTFKFTPTDEYRGINSVDKYTAFRNLVKDSTFNFTAKFEKAA
ncbi:MAG: hypothetical protein SPG94_02750 [Candidatus Enterosoma sp.]|nr:hypothetical protein [bacterium]MDY5548201.1 hypothetical protein [Candidatus Enterosoma sp.]